MAFDPTAQLAIYNAALVDFLGSKRLGSLSDNVESRYILDQIWDNGFLDRVLQHGWWKHAMRAVKITYDPDYTASFGFTYSFDKPSDFVRLYSMTSDEFFRTPVDQYQHDRGKWFCDYQEIYVRYVSNGDDYGLDVALWPESFKEYVEGYLALKAVKRITDSQADKEELTKEVRDLKIKAKSEDALEEPTGLVVPSGWAVARGGYENGRRRQHPYR